MDKQKISSMFDKFLVNLFLDEMAEDEAAKEELEAIERQIETPQLFEEPEEGWTNNYDGYMFGLANHLMEEYGLDQEAVMGCIMDTAQLFIEKKALPALPKGEVEVEDLDKWVQAAEAIQLDEAVVEVVDRLMVDAVAEEMKGDDEGSAE